MLIEKGFSEGDVVSLKLLNGDEIIARFESENEKEVKINKPLALNLGPQGLGMIPWIFLAETESFTLQKTHIFAIAQSKKDAAAQYVQGTTGITLVK